MFLLFPSIEQANLSIPSQPALFGAFPKVGDFSSLEGRIVVGVVCLFLPI